MLAWGGRSPWDPCSHKGGRSVEPEPRLVHLNDAAAEGKERSSSAEFQPTGVLAWWLANHPVQLGVFVVFGWLSGWVSELSLRKVTPSAGDLKTEAQIMLTVSEGIKVRN